MSSKKQKDTERSAKLHRDYFILPLVMGLVDPRLKLFPMWHDENSTLHWQRFFLSSRHSKQSGS
ncbi:hypothetical protein LEMLEM_LOCUS17296 [Lemmus lemmus]